MITKIISTRKEKRVYVIGHKNPDTDSVVSAAAYAAFKKTLGDGNYVAARAGKVTPQTEFVFNRFNMPLPEYLSDLIPKVEYYYNPAVKTVSADMSLWQAMSLLQNIETRTLAVVDEHGCYHSLLHYSFLAQKMLQLVDPKQKTAINTSVEMLASVLNAQVQVLHSAKEIKKSPIVVAAAEYGTFKKVLDAHIPENTFVIACDRTDIIRYALQSGVRALITTNGYLVDKELRKLADERGVSVLASPYDTSSTTLLLIYSMPVKTMSNTDLRPVHRDDPIRKIAPLLGEAPGKSLPVVDDDNRVVGVISENDIFKEADIEVAMVDHNEPSQAVEGIENYRIREIIDHHRLGNLTTRYPITFINKPVGATSTIVANLYQENHLPLSPGMAGILLCGILADTLSLQSATTTRRDRDTADYLSTLANLDIDELGRELMAAASNIAGRSAEQLVRQDMKKYTENDRAFTVSQIEVGSTREVLGRKSELLAALEAVRKENGGLFSALLVTDITELSSLMLVAADEKFLHYVSLPKLEDSVYIMRDVVSRKKQLLPILSELVEHYFG